LAITQSFCYSFFLLFCDRISPLTTKSELPQLVKTSPEGTLLVLVIFRCWPMLWQVYQCYWTLWTVWPLPGVRLIISCLWPARWTLPFVHSEDSRKWSNQAAM